MKKLKADIKNLVLNNKADELKSLWDNSKESLMQFCPLHFAASAGKTDILKSLIQTGADPDMKDKFGRTPLFMAVLNNRVKISEWLLDMGASPETIFSYNTTLLHIAVKRINKAALELLLRNLKNKEFINTNDFFGYTPLHLSAMLPKNGSADIEELSPADVFDWEELIKTFLYSQSPYITKLRKFFYDYAKTWYPDNLNLRERIENGCELTQQQKERFLSNLSIYASVEEKYADPMNEVIADKYYGNDTDIFVERKRYFFDRYFYHCVACGNGWSLAETLLENGAEIDPLTIDGKTPLLMSMSNANFLLSRHLIRKGADVNRKDEEGSTPASFIHIFQGGINDMVDLVLEKGVDLSIRDKNSCSPFFSIFLNGDKDVIMKCISAGADINMEDSYHYTPLMYFTNFSSFHSDHKQIKLLVELGADPYLETESGNSAYTLAMLNNHRAALHIFRQSKENTGKPPEIKTESDLTSEEKQRIKKLILNEQVEEIAKIIGKKGLQSNNMGFSPFHFAASAGKVNVAEVFPDNGEDINIKDKWGRTPLYMAVLNNNTDMVRWLLERGASVEITYPETGSIIHLAIRKSGINILKLLLNHLNNSELVNTIDSSGNTPLQVFVAQIYRNQHNSIRIPNLEKFLQILESAELGFPLSLKKHIEDSGYSCNFFDVNETTLGCYERLWIESCVNSFLHKYEQSEGFNYVQMSGLIDEAFPGCFVLSDITEVLTLLIENGADPNINGKPTSNILNDFLSACYYREAEYLIQNGVKPDSYSLISLFLNYSDKGERLLDLFLSQGIYQSIFKNEIYNPLLHIASRGEKKVLRKFIEAGIDIDPVNSDGYSPLMWLIKIGECEMAETFLQLGANPVRKTKSGLTAYDLARTTRRIPMLKLLERYGVEK